jgi:dTDP-4-amino-4,6-dideoxygalactose transaminase
VKVPYLSLQSQFQDEVLWVAVKKQIDACQFILGPEVERFESRFADLCGVPFAICVNSGTDALFLALRALDVGPGDEVITVPNSFIATTGAIVASGAKPVFVDVGPDYNMDVALIKAAISSRTKVILPVHLTGNPADILNITAIASENNLRIVEDAAQAVGAMIGGGRVGSFGDFGCFSLHPLKNLNVCGDGGVVTTKSAELAEKIRMLRNHGLKNRDEIEFFGYNSRMDSLRAAVANHMMEKLEGVMGVRQRNARIYDARLSELDGFVILPPRRKDAVPVFHTYVVQVQKRASLISYLAEHGVETKVHYPVPNHLQKPCREWGHRKGDFPVCERQAEMIISLPIHQFLEEEHIRYVTDLVRSFYGVA